MANKELLLPSLRCAMGDWIYYVTTLRFREIAERVSFENELNLGEELDERLQRELGPRGKQISKYLLNNPQRLFNALTIAVYGGEPEWLDVALTSSRSLDISGLDDDTEERIDSTLGLLRLSGQEKLFALDGQHRVSGIKEAFKENAELGEDEVCVIFVGHQKTTEGMIRSRRLFTTLNRYAKPVSKSDIVILDEDDASAITTRRLMKTHPLLAKAKTATGTQTSIPRTDKTSLTTIISIYEIANTLALKREVGGVKWSPSNLRGPRPAEEKLEALYIQNKSFWDALVTSFPPLRELAESDSKTSEVAGKYRTADGGNLLFRPIGQTAFARAVRALLSQGHTIESAVAKLSRLNLDLASKQWTGVLWNSASRTMMTTMEHRDVAADLMLYFINAKVDEDGLTKRYQALTDNPKAKLPPR